jgi:hypothetical protein
MFTKSALGSYPFCAFILYLQHGKSRKLKQQAKTATQKSQLLLYGRGKKGKAVPVLN